MYVNCFKNGKNLICFVIIYVRLKDYKGGDSWLMLASWLVNTRACNLYFLYYKEREKMFVVFFFLNLKVNCDIVFSNKFMNFFSYSRWIGNPHIEIQLLK
jgi:hypothetical protein